ncbi:MAG: MarR family transcriptional regulator [Bacteroidia bacterium]|jgi:DNA-binding MarR family transcriptional regulator|nr:MarR family transcriptional regulator [Bacteroidia bacterium]
MKIEDAIKQKQFKSLDQKLVINLMYTLSWLTGEQHRYFKQYGISSQQYNVLRILKGQHGKPSSVGLIQDRMLDKNSNASRLIEKLKLKNLVDRTACPSDRRQVDVVITEAGLQLLEEINKSDKQLHQITENLSDEEKKLMSDLLDKLRENKE